MRLLPIKNYEDLYSISDCGKVYSHISNKFLKHGVNKYGYHFVFLCKDKVKTQYKVYRLVAQAFLDNPDSLPEINHIDENKDNNHVSNLQWITRQGNQEHSLAKHYKLKNPDGELVEIFNLAKFCRDKGLSPSSISRVLKGEQDNHRGWRYGY